MMKKQWPSNRRVTAWILRVFFWVSWTQVLLIAGIWAYSRWASAKEDPSAELSILFAVLPVIKWVDIISLGIIVALSLLLIFVWLVRREKVDEPKQED